MIIFIFALTHLYELVYNFYIRNAYLLENSSEFKSTFHHETIMSACQECGPSFHVLRYIINTEKVHQMHDCVSIFINYCSLWDFLALPNSGILSESNIITISLCKHVVFSLPGVLETSLLIHMVYWFLFTRKRRTRLTVLRN